VGNDDERASGKKEAISSGDATSRREKEGLGRMVPSVESVLKCISREEEDKEQLD